MELRLVRAGREDAGLIWRMQIEAFAKLYQTYQDTETSPAAEPIEKTAARLEDPFSYFYLIQSGSETVGAIRVIDKKEADIPKRISPLFILPQFWNQGIAQEAIRKAEQLHGRANWELDTILQESGNCHLYEKMGYCPTGKTRVINEKLTLVFYRKD